MTPKMETAADRYRRLAKEKEVVQSATCPECGMEWKCKRAKLDYWVASGIIPSSLAAVMAQAIKQKGMTEMEAMSSLNLQQLAQSIESTSNIVKYTAVEPRISDDGKADAIAPDEVMMCCYNFLRDWQMKGGAEAARLETFRPE